MKFATGQSLKILLNLSVLCCKLHEPANFWSSQVTFQAMQGNVHSFFKENVQFILVVQLQVLTP